MVDEIREELLDAVFERADWFSCNAREAAMLTDSTDVAEAARLLRGRMRHGASIVRNGAEGCVVAQSDSGSDIVPGFAVVSVDTNGAGDCHVGAFAAQLALGKSPLEAARCANAAAAMSVTKHGPATGPTRGELDAFLAQKKTEQSS
jgi:sugar/nucleoside kinase (ribokinase family)